MITITAIAIEIVIIIGLVENENNPIVVRIYPTER